MKHLLIRCDASQSGDISYGAYTVWDDDPVPIELTSGCHGTQAEVELICKIIELLPRGKLTIHHDVRQMASVLRKESFRAARWLAYLMKDGRVTLMYIRKRYRHEQYYRCHRASRAAVREHKKRIMVK